MLILPPGMANSDAVLPAERAPGPAAADDAFADYFRCADEVLGSQNPPELNGSGRPKDFSDMVTNLRRERYLRVAPAAERVAGSGALRSIYYALRPVLGVSIRKHLQRVRLSGW